jgi:hypothetical protein
MTMNSVKKTVISASILVVAAQAMSVAAREHSGTIELPSAFSGVEANDAFKRPDVRVAVGEAFPAVVTKFSIDGETIRDRYLVAQNQDFTSGSGTTFTDEGLSASDQISCHSACHSAGGGYC